MLKFDTLGILIVACWFPRIHGTAFVVAELSGITQLMGESLWVINV
jgi:hypothetical protein